MSNKTKTFSSLSLLFIFFFNFLHIINLVIYKKSFLDIQVFLSVTPSRLGWHPSHYVYFNKNSSSTFLLCPKKKHSIWHQLVHFHTSPDAPAPQNLQIILFIILFNKRQTKKLMHIKYSLSFKSFFS